MAARCAPARAGLAVALLLLLAGCQPRMVGGSGFGRAVQVCDSDGCRVQPREAQTLVIGEDERLRRQADPDLYRGESVAELRGAAAAGDAGAAYRLGQAYEYGAGGLPRSAGQAARQYEVAAAAGMPFAMFRLGRLAEQGAAPGGRARAIELYAAAANGGVAQAAHNLGYLYLQGRGLPRDMAEAARWSTLAAEKGVPESQYNLALMYFRGEGVSRQPYEALQWMRRAAQNGYLPAQKAVGRLYMTGLEEMGQDLQEARSWLSLAASRGDAESRRWLQQIEQAERAERAYQQQLTMQAAQTQALWAQAALAAALAPPPVTVVIY
ncbi:sel1 repeat family protein [Belnapia sp. T6]|uniref:Sel1 repeat family protein n=1 Tax=Belnapia mucosa TaxID=2804532 RepID=A0ABS1V1P2_9PROT|nr:tetratricopeptide repeat protein [Belnapia mucosa]MBL6455182.1 sel1 repeat family protein [Belnapia mucosa]